MCRVLLGVLLGASLAAPVPVSAQAPSPTSRWRPFEIQKHPQAANTFLAGPATGGATIPTFRPLVAADLPAGDPLAQYLLLAGRSGGQTANGGTATSDSLTLNANSQAWAQGNTGRINMGERITMFPSGLSAVTGTLNFMNSTSTFTQTGSSANFYAYGFDGSIVLSTAPFIGIPPVLAATNAFVTAPSTMSLAAPGAIQANWHIIADGAGTVLTLSNLFSSMIDSPSIGVSNGGAISNTSTYASYDSKMSITTGATMGTRQMYKVTDASGAGSLVGQIGYDCPALAKGTSLNACFRSAVAANAGINYFLRDTGGADSVVKGQLRLGDTTDPTALFDVVGKYKLNTSGVTTVYNNVAKDGSHNGVPFTGWHDTQTGQTANLAAHDFTVAISSATAGRYRLCCYEAVTTAATTSSLLPDCNVVCTDPTDSVAKTVVAASSVAASSVGNGNTTGTSISGCGVCDAKAATTIKYSTSNYTSVGVTNMAYKVYVTLEAM